MVKDESKSKTMKTVFMYIKPSCSFFPLPSDSEVLDEINLISIENELSKTKKRN